MISLKNTEKITPKEGEFLLLVSLNKSYDQSKAKGVYIRTNNYDSTRRYWRIDSKRIPKIDYVLGIYKGVVKTVFKPIKWQTYDCADDGTMFKTTRYGFEGEAVPNSPYLNKDVSEFPFGSGGAIAYIPRNRQQWF